MKHLDTGSEKVKKICDAIRLETLEPAKQQARAILEQASDQAALIIQEARQQAESMLEHAKKQHEKDRHIFEASMAHAAKLFKETLRLEIEEHFLAPSLNSIVGKLFEQSQLVAQLVTALVHGFNQKSLNGDLVLILSKHLNKAHFVEYLAEDVRRQVVDIQTHPSLSGIALKSVGDNLRLEISQEQLASALLESIRIDFRKYFYQGF